MTTIGSVLNEMMTTVRAKGDYTDGEGFLVCGKCGTRKQHELHIPEFGGELCGVRRVPVPCECRKAELAAKAERENRLDFKQKMEALRRDGITDPAYLRHTFDNDDRRDPRLSDICKRYVEVWEEMKADNTGILFFGSIGTGKTFLACCIANALLERLISVSVTNFPRILNRLQSPFGEDDRQAIIDRLQRYSLLVVDDLGTERDTSYGAEQVFNVVDTRARSGKPLIVTTNLSVSEMQSAQGLAERRLYDRILGMCPIRLRLTGESRRAENAAEKRDRAKRLLKLE